MNPRLSAAMTSDIDQELRAHLLRDDDQEDVCLATYTVSTGRNRVTMILRSVILPEPGERRVHGNASFTGDYILRGAALAASRKEGLVILHSHPAGIGWQDLSEPDNITESGYSGAAGKITGMPVLGMTLGGCTLSWSARRWTSRWEHENVESVRVVGEQLRLTWNDGIRPLPQVTAAQVRTVSAWGSEIQGDFARLRILVVGTGSIGLDVAQRIAASGIAEVGVMDFDEVEEKNLDRMIGAVRSDARLRRAKVVVAGRLMRTQATARKPQINEHEASLCTPTGLATALDYDVVFSCVDRPWPRAILNTIAYADLIPVIDGGINIENTDDGRMRSASARAHTLVPGRPCLVCIRQLRPDQIQLDRQGLLDDQDYIKQAGAIPKTTGQNVATLSATVSAMLLAQFVSLVAAPGGTGVPDALCFHFRRHAMEHLEATTQPGCRWEQLPGEGDNRVKLASAHPHAERMIAARIKRQARIQHQLRERLHRLFERLSA